MTSEDDNVIESPVPSDGPDALRSRNARRRWLGALIALGAVLLLVVTPCYLATRPSFFGHFPKLQSAYAPWAESKHKDASCQSCHVRPGFFPQTGYKVRMIGEFYRTIFSKSGKPKVFAKPTNAACVACHDDLKSISPKGDLKIPHRAHVNLLKMRCVACHTYLVHEKSPEGKHTPPMSGCLTCHDGDTAKDSCTACHTNKAAPASHKAADWSIVHAEKGQEPSCNSCHKWTANWCADCHTRRPDSHATGWREGHQVYVAKHRNCEACHAGSFCIRCHGEVPMLNFDPNMKLVR